MAGSWRPAFRTCQRGSDQAGADVGAPSFEGKDSAEECRFPTSSFVVRMGGQKRPQSGWVSWHECARANRQIYRRPAPAKTPRTSRSSSAHNGNVAGMQTLVL